MHANSIRLEKSRYAAKHPASHPTPMIIVVDYTVCHLAIRAMPLNDLHRFGVNLDNWRHVIEDVEGHIDTELVCVIIPGNHKPYMSLHRVK